METFTGQYDIIVRNPILPNKSNNRDVIGKKSIIFTINTTKYNPVVKAISLTTRLKKRNYRNCYKILKYQCDMSIYLNPNTVMCSGARVV